MASIESVSETALTIDQIKEKVVPVAKKYNIPVVYVFGSHAHGTASEKSDIDLLVEKRESSLETFFDELHFKEECEKKS